jgi:hypothetical protein
MKKLFVVVILFYTSISFSQDADTSDYFRFGLYGGSYISQYPLYERNKYINSIALETEYVKLKNLSFYIKSIFEFTGSDISVIYNDYSPYLVTIKSPDTYRLAMSFGGKYYLKEKNIRPYFQLGINHQTDCLSDHSYYYNYGRGITSDTTKIRGYYKYFFSVNIGAGLNINLCKKLSLDIQYDLYRSLQEHYSTFQGFSVLAGIKYSII